MTKPVLVLLPGLLNTARIFDPVIAALGDAAQVIVPELYRYDSMTSMANAVLTQAPERFALGGFSMGGYVCFEILRRAPQRVERLALIDTQAHPDSPEATVRRRGQIEQVKLGRFHGMQPVLLPMLVHASNLGRAEVTEPMVEMAGIVGPDGFVREQRAIMARPDSRPQLVDIAVPTVVISGRHDQSIPVVRAEEMAADISNSELVVIEECGHMAPLEKPAEVAAALRRWLSR